jgi:glycosyltransferase involved in cell wall biosynthesis
MNKTSISGTTVRAKEIQMKHLDININPGTKIHFVHLSAGPGGIEVLLPKIAKHANNRHFSAMVIRPRPEKTNVYDHTGIPVTYGSKRNLAAAWCLFRYARKHRDEIFHAFNLGPFFLLIIRLSGVRKLVYSIHGTIYWKKPYQKGLFRMLWRLSMSQTFRFTANSAYSRHAFLTRANPSPDIQILYNPIDGKRFSPPDVPVSHDGIRIVYTGRLHQGKNLLQWIDIAVDLHHKLDQTCFEIYGQGPLQETLQKKIDDAQASSYIRLKGFRKEIEEVYKHADLLIFLSEYESFGNVVVESILCGTPVLVSPIPAMKEIFGEFPQFLLADEKGWKEEIFQKVQDLPQLKKLASQAREVFLERYSMDYHVKTLSSIYDAFE